MKKTNLLLLLGVIVLAVVPFVLHKPQEGEEAFMGADGEAGDLAAEKRPDYEPWYSSFWEPPSGEVESALFALQAAIGAGVLCYAIGYYRGRHIGRTRTPADASG